MKVIDQFLDKEVFAQLQKSQEAIFSKKNIGFHWLDIPIEKYQKDIEYSRHLTCKETYKDLICMILNQFASLTSQDISHFAGVEYWYNKSNELTWHQDVDEKKLIETGELAHPSLSMVFYLDTLEKGGILEISTSKCERHNISSTFKVKSVQNRLVFFDPSHWHRVTPFSGFMRRAVTLNLWNYPIEILEYDEAFSHNYVKLLG